MPGGLGYRGDDRDETCFRLARLEFLLEVVEIAFVDVEAVDHVWFAAQGLADDFAADRSGGAGDEDALAAEEFPGALGVGLDDRATEEVAGGDGVEAGGVVAGEDPSNRGHRKEWDAGVAGDVGNSLQIELGGRGHGEDDGFDMLAINDGLESAGVAEDRKIANAGAEQRRVIVDEGDRPKARASSSRWSSLTMRFPPLPAPTMRAGLSSSGAPESSVGIATLAMRDGRTESRPKTPAIPLTSNPPRIPAESEIVFQASLARIRMARPRMRASS